MEYLRKISEYRIPTKLDMQPYNTFWIYQGKDGLSEVYIQRGKKKTKWEFVGVEIGKHLEEFWRDDEEFLTKVRYVFNLDDEEVEHLKQRMYYSH